MIVIKVSGGVLQGVFTDRDDLGEVVLLDYDTDGEEGKPGIYTLSEDDREYQVYIADLGNEVLKLEDLPLEELTVIGDVLSPASPWDQHPDLPEDVSGPLWRTSRPEDEAASDAVILMECFACGSLVPESNTVDLNWSIACRRCIAITLCVGGWYLA